MKSHPKKQHGAALLIALMFLIILTLLSVNAMRSSTMELRMAGNEQERRIGFDSTQSAKDMVAASNKLFVSNIGDVSCFGFGSDPGCTGTNMSNTDLGVGVGVGSENIVRAKLDAIAACPRSSGNSMAIDASYHTGAPGGCAYFSVQSSYNATDRRGGRVETVEGYIKLINN